MGGGASWRHRIAVTLHGRRHTDGREDGSWVGMEACGQRQGRVGTSTVWRSPCMRALHRHGMHAWLVLGCRTCTQDLQQEKIKKMTY